MLKEEGKKPNPPDTMTVPPQAIPMMSLDRWDPLPEEDDRKRISLTLKRGDRHYPITIPSYVDYSRKIKDQKHLEVKFHKSRITIQYCDEKLKYQRRYDAPPLSEMAVKEIFFLMEEKNWEDKADRDDGIDSNRHSIIRRKKWYHLFSSRPDYTLMKIGYQIYLVSNIKPHLGGAESHLRVHHPIWKVQIDGRSYLVIGPAEYLKKRKIPSKIQLDEKKGEKIVEHIYLSKIGIGNYCRLYNQGNSHVAFFHKQKRNGENERQTTVNTSEPILSGKDVDTLLKQDILTSDERLKIAIGMVKDLIRLQREKNYIHRDIKPGNELFDGQTVNSIDLNYGIFLEDDSNGEMSFFGTYKYSAPEVLELQGGKKETRLGKRFKQADVYSLGISLIILLNINDEGKNHPFQQYLRKPASKFPMLGGKKDLEKKPSEFVYHCEECQKGKSKIGKTLQDMIAWDPDKRPSSIRSPGSDRSALESFLTELTVLSEDRQNQHKFLLLFLKDEIKKNWPSGKYPAGITQINELIETGERLDWTPEEISERIYQVLKRGKEDSDSFVSNQIRWRSEKTQHFYQVWEPVYKDFLYSNTRGVLTDTQKMMIAELRYEINKAGVGGLQSSLLKKLCDEVLNESLPNYKVSYYFHEIYQTLKSKTPSDFGLFHCGDRLAQLYQEHYAKFHSAIMQGNAFIEEGEVIVSKLDELIKKNKEFEKIGLLRAASCDKFRIAFSPAEKKTAVQFSQLLRDEYKITQNNDVIDSEILADGSIEFFITGNNLRKINSEYRTDSKNPHPCDMGVWDPLAGALVFETPLAAKTFLKEIRSNSPIHVYPEGSRAAGKAYVLFKPSEISRIYSQLVSYFASPSPKHPMAHLLPQAGLKTEAAVSNRSALPSTAIPAESRSSLIL